VFAKKILSYLSKKVNLPRRLLHPREYLVYAYNALTRVVEILLEQQEGLSP
jgi:hypothetical protein